MKLSNRAHKQTSIFTLATCHNSRSRSARVCMHAHTHTYTQYYTLRIYMHIHMDVSGYVCTLISLWTAFLTCINDLYATTICLNSLFVTKQ